MAIGRAPLLQFGRGRVLLLREAQTFHEDFKFCRHLGDAECCAAPIGISVSSHNILGEADLRNGTLSREQ
jgi:hypothetical protein